MFNLTPFELEQREKNRQLQRRIYIETVKNRVNVSPKKKALHHHPFMPSTTHPTEMIEVVPEFESDEKRKLRINAKLLKEKESAPNVIRDAETGEIISFTTTSWNGFEGKVKLTPMSIFQRGTGKLDVLKEHVGPLPLDTDKKAFTQNPLIPFVEQIGPVTIRMHKDWNPKTGQVARLPEVRLHGISSLQIPTMSPAFPIGASRKLTQIEYADHSVDSARNSGTNERDSDISYTIPDLSSHNEFLHSKQPSFVQQSSQRQSSLRFQLSTVDEVTDSDVVRGAEKGTFSPKGMKRHDSKSALSPLSPPSSISPPLSPPPLGVSSSDGPTSTIGTLPGSRSGEWSSEPSPLPQFIPSAKAIATPLPTATPPMSGRPLHSPGLSNYHGFHQAQRGCQYEALSISTPGMEWANSLQNWKDLEDRYFHEIVQTVCDLERNKSLTHEKALSQKSGQPGVKATCRKLARLKAMGMFQVAQAIYDEELREAQRQKNLVECTGGALRVAKLKEDYHKERIAKQEYIESLRKDNEIIFLTKVSELDWLW